MADLKVSIPVEMNSSTTTQTQTKPVIPKAVLPDVAGDAFMLLSLKSAPASPSHGGCSMVTDFANENADIKSENKSAMAKLAAKGVEHLIRNKRTIIGRDSSAGKVDVNMGISSFISRRHIEIYHEDPNSFLMVCKGKNGVFVDGVFQRKGAAPYKLPPSCVFRFPSTAIRLEFTSLIADRNANILTEVNEEVEKSLKNNSCKNIPDSLDGTMGPSSPTATISAANSCPSSPRSSNRVRHENIFGNKQQDEFKKAVAFAASAMTKEQTINHEPHDLLKPLPPPVLDATAQLVPVTPKPKPRRSRDSGKSAYKPTPANSTLNSSFNSSGEFLFHIEPTEDTNKPPYSYAQLIVQAIASAPDQQLTLNDIYSWITKTYPFYRTADKGWQNSIRHNLSLNRYFLKIARCQTEPGKGSFWKIDPACIDKLTEQSFKKRRQRPASAFGPETPTRFVPHVSRDSINNINNLDAFSAEAERAAAAITGQEVLESEIISTDFNTSAPAAVGPSTFIVSSPFPQNQPQGQTANPGQTMKLLVDSSKLPMGEDAQQRIGQMLSNGTAFFLDSTQLPPGARIAVQGQPNASVNAAITMANIVNKMDDAPMLKSAPAGIPHTVIVGGPKIGGNAGEMNRIVIDASNNKTLTVHQQPTIISVPVSKILDHQPSETITVTGPAPAIPSLSQTVSTNPIDILTNVALMSDPTVTSPTKIEQKVPISLEVRQSPKMVSVSMPMPTVTLPIIKSEQPKIVHTITAPPTLTVSGISALTAAAATSGAIAGVKRPADDNDKNLSITDNKQIKTTEE